MQKFYAEILVGFFLFLMYGFVNALQNTAKQGASGVRNAAK